MRTELRVILPGPEGSADTRRAVDLLGRFISLLGELEDAATGAGGADRTTWGLTEVALGSLVLTLAPSTPRRGVTTDTLDGVMDLAVTGFAAAEERGGIPDGWDVRTATTAAGLAGLLDLLPSGGLHLELRRNQERVRVAIVTRLAEEHLNEGLRIRHRSIGSAVGRLDTVTLHDKRTASLWLERTSVRVPVVFTNGQIDEVRAAWGKRVEVAGLLDRGPNGHILRIKMRSIEVLPDQAPPLAGLVGLDSSYSGGLSPGDYLRDIRGAS